MADDLAVTVHGLSGDWAEIAPGVEVRGLNMPNEEDIDWRDMVVIQVRVAKTALKAGEHG